jgi:mannose-6-phosphate isomerase
MDPVRLGSNQPPRFYRGGDSIARFRGLPGTRDDVPEDWVGSTTTMFGEPRLGLTTLPDGRLLRAAIVADPDGWLGRAHVQRYGTNPALLVKLLDAAERLPVHCHPSDEFSRRHLDCPFGKTEAWVIVEADDGAAVHLGFRHDIDATTLHRWVAEQEVAALLDALHRVRVSAGDAVLVPAGIPHAIGAGIFLVELQEPADLNVLLEWTGFDVDGARDGHMGLGYEVALGCVDRSGWSLDRIAALRRSATHERGTGTGAAPVLPPEADAFFRCERVGPEAPARLTASFAVVVVIGGTGTLETERGVALRVRAGDTLVVPHAAGDVTLHGPVSALRCRPSAVPEPS